MKVGAHVSAADGLEQAPINAAKAGCECFQFFTRSPQGGPAPILTGALVAKFKKACHEHRLPNYYVHTPYYINLASANNRIRYGSISVIKQELERSSMLGVRALMTHLGSSADLGQKAALKKVIEGLKKVLDGYHGSTQFLIEISAGTGNIIGDTFEEIGSIISALPQYNIGVCFDTCHAFASGYDLQTEAAVEKTLKHFDQHVGLEKLQLVHANDAKFELGSHVDRHEHLGLGKIGVAGFQALLHHPAIKKVDFILETPKDGKKVNDLTLLKQWRG